MKYTTTAGAHDHAYWMRLALEEARRAAEAGEVPVGALLVREGSVLGRGRNRVEQTHDPSAHAEMAAIREACAALGYERLAGTALYVTLEPCAMCAGAIVLARIERLIFGAADPKTGACGSMMNVVQDRRLNHRVEVIPGILADECAARLRMFFRALRNRGTRDGSSSREE